MLRQIFTSLLKPDTSNWPSRCWICESWPSQAVCPPCWQRFKPPHDSIKLQGRMEHEHLAWHWCAALFYEYPWDSLILAYKFNGQVGLATHLAQLMLQAPRIRAQLEACDYVLPVPIHPERLAQRGYNQSTLLAQALVTHCKRIGIETKSPHSHPKVLSGALLRVQTGLDQVGLREEQRWRNVKNQFAVHPEFAHLLANKRLLVLDDILTTGATLHSCIRVLMAHQPATIQALVLAKTVTS